MKIEKWQIEGIINNLQELLETMENLEIESVHTSCNTYGLGSNFISFGSNGYLSLEEYWEDYLEEDRD